MLDPSVTDVAEMEGNLLRGLDGAAVACNAAVRYNFRMTFFHQLSCTCSGVSTELGNGHVWPCDNALPIFGPVHHLINLVELSRDTLTPKRFLSAPQLPLQCICTFQSAPFASPGAVDSIVPEMPKAEKLTNSVNLIASYQNRISLVQNFWPIIRLKLTWVFRVPSGNMATQILRSSVRPLGCQRFFTSHLA